MTEGTKSVAKSLKKIMEGPIRGRGVSWFPELVDKRKYHFTLDYFWVAQTGKHSVLYC